MRNALIRHGRAFGERTAAELKEGWRALQHVTLNPSRTGDTARAARVLTGAVTSCAPPRTGACQLSRTRWRNIAWPHWRLAVSDHSAVGAADMSAPTTSRLAYDAESMITMVI
ncbi:hypothetical protein ACIBI9_46875 [Nonomuraea sp. NPDC050451]|uniref:hypothetical protein n=1 Tax=Nonomuraea sp. NPDC050451 TaxID=3364364 RepID=UPI003791F66F